MFENFYREETKNNPNLSIEFADKVIALDVPVSAAQVQGMFMFYKNDALKAVENAFRFQPKPSSKDA